MEVQKAEILAKGRKLFIEEDRKEIARAYLYILKNDLHEQPFGFMEDVFIDEEYRGRGIGSKLVRAVIEEARNSGCYKLICTSRHEKPDVHSLYEKLGFKNHGLEFRIDF